MSLNIGLLFFIGKNNEKTMILLEKTIKTIKKQ
jgi:hypothetical protein